jgi:hypothetical protein
MIGIFKTEQVVASGVTFEGIHYKIPLGKIWRLDKLTFQNVTAARGNLALICVTSGVVNYISPLTAMDVAAKVLDLQGIYLTEADEIYIYISGLTIGDNIKYTIRGFEKDLVGVDFII